MHAPGVKMGQSSRETRGPGSGVWALFLEHQTTAGLGTWQTGGQGDLLGSS